MTNFFKRVLCLTCFLIIAGCGARNDLAPVSEVKWYPYSRHQNTHIVRAGETLYAISFRYDTDYRRLAALNHIPAPYSLRVGQVLKVQGIANPQPYNSRPVRPTIRPTQPIRRPVAPQVVRTPVYQNRAVGAWMWPVTGQVITGFVPTQGKKGINIASRKGDKVIASAAGVVAYAGSGLAGYGNLIIIKHNNEYLTAYGNNSRNLVSEGQRVAKGQAIAEVGVLEHRYWGVHFEIRKTGIPVNPLNYLQKG